MWVALEPLPNVVDEKKMNTEIDVDNNDPGLEDEHM